MSDSLTPGGHYATINKLKLYYEVHGQARPNQPSLVLIHGGLSTINSSFGRLLPALAKQHHVIAVELQGHGHTADTDRPFSYEAFADDIAALVEQLELGPTNLLGYSVGAGVALRTAMRHPAVVNKLVLAAVSYNDAAIYPEIKAMSAEMAPEMLDGTPFHQDYLAVAPQPENWHQLIAKNNAFEKVRQDWPASEVQAVKAPALLIYGDCDIIMPEHAVELFRLLGGGKPGDMGEPAPASRLAIIPATSHISLVDRLEIVPMVNDFLAS